MIEGGAFEHTTSMFTKPDDPAHFDAIDEEDEGVFRQSSTDSGDLMLA